MTEELELTEDTSLDEEDEERVITHRLSKDLKTALGLLNREQAKYFVATYYRQQKERIAASAQVESSKKQGLPNEALIHINQMYAQNESKVASMLKVYAQSQVAGRWALSILGIGPVIAAGLLAYLDPERSLTAGAVWRFSGSDPTSKWLGAQGAKDLIFSHLGPGKGSDIIDDGDLVTIAFEAGIRASNLFARVANERGEMTRDALVAELAKRPWNAKLKVLRWKIGISIMKSCNSPNSYYGPLYRQRKLYEMEQNNAGAYAEQARLALQEKNYSDNTDAKKYYLQGKLPPAHIQARALRWVAKIFLSHFQAVLYESYFGEPAPKPYILEFGGHKDMIEIPNWPMQEELPDAVVAARKAHWAAYKERVKAKAVQPLSGIEWAELKKLFGHKCAYCGKVQFGSNLERSPLPQGHYIGGLYKQINVVPACKQCNEEQCISPAKPKHLPTGWKFNEEPGL